MSTVFPPFAAGAASRLRFVTVTAGCLAMPGRAVKLTVSRPVPPRAGRPYCQHVLKSANLAVKLLLELAAFAALAYWGASTGHGALSVVLAIAAPLAAVIVWSSCCAPRARRRVATPARVPLELAVFRQRPPRDHLRHRGGAEQRAAHRGPAVRGAGAAALR